jgi:predicted short-subunit dehydrogenase-like oxidoreductase (DUF2520 family)
MNKKLGIIGPGKLGTSLYRALAKSGYDDIRMIGRSEASVLRDLVISSDIIFVTVSDDELSNVCLLIDALEENLYGRIIIHFSGQKSSDIFEALRKKGALCASMHPLTTFSSKESEDALYKAYIAHEGDDCCDVIKDIFKEYELRIIKITKAQKTKYHAAAVISSNLLCALLDISDSMLKEIGLIGGISLHEPLILTTLQNIFRTGTHKALTGPAQRGDLSTIAGHLDVLQGEERKIYTMLTLRALKMASSQNPDNQKKYEMIEKELID